MSVRLHTSNRFDLWLTVAGYLFLLWLYVRTLIFPERHTNFLYHTGVMLFVLEFLSIFLIVALEQLLLKKLKHERKGGQRRNIAAFILFPLTFACIVASATGEWILLLMFVVTMAIRGYRIWKNQQLDGMITKIVIGIFSTVGVCVLASSLIAGVIPLPAEVYAAKPEDMGGLFVDEPQVGMVWGILYFTALLVMDVLINPKVFTRMREED